MENLILATELEINLWDLSRKVRWLSYKNNIFREKILEQGDEEVPIEIRIKAVELRECLCYCPEFCEKSGFDYNIKSIDSRLIKTAIAFYLLKKYKNL